jgi:hypothetical protein
MVTCRISPRKSLLKRLRFLVVSTDWDEEFLAQEKWINRTCLAIIIFSILYFAPIVISTLTRIPVTGLP